MSTNNKGTKNMAKKNKASKGVGLSNVRETSKVIMSVSSINSCQKEVLRTIAKDENHIVFLEGIAGSGKTYLSVSWGLEQMLKGKFEKIIVTRPYVEAGESLGYLPGTFTSKIAPFMIPIFDVLNEYLSHEDIKELMESNKLVILPLAYMRGVTFKNAFVILDEGQNSTITQMHLFLTRIGQGSKMVITGDTSQSDLGMHNGFTDALNILRDLEGVGIVELKPSSVVRHPIIQSLDSRYKSRTSKKE
jgi:phosphate starvation-inducible PhoH-like protein